MRVINCWGLGNDLVRLGNDLVRKGFCCLVWLLVWCLEGIGKERINFRRLFFDLYMRITVCEYIRINKENIIKIKKY